METENKEKKYTEEIPTGLAMQLAADRVALDRFVFLSAAEKERVISAAKNAKSKGEMREIVESIQKSSEYN